MNKFRSRNSQGSIIDFKPNRLRKCCVIKYGKTYERDGSQFSPGYE